MRLDDETRRRLAFARELLAAEGPAAPVAAIARRAGISPYHFIRVFEATFGVTPHRFRSDVRLARARRFLAQGAPVTQVCMQLGFSSLGSFSALFARRVGDGIPLTSFESSDIAAEAKRLKQAGVVFTKEPMQMGPVIIAVFADTCGNLIQLHQPA